MLSPALGSLITALVRYCTTNCTGSTSPTGFSSSCSDSLPVLNGRAPPYLSEHCKSTHSLLSIDIFCLRGAQQQIRRTPRLLSIDGTDGRTDARPFHRPCSACYAGSVNKNYNNKLPKIHAEVVNAKWCSRSFLGDNPFITCVILTPSY